jgi:opacity protein-like surface antigen
MRAAFVALLLGWPSVAMAEPYVGAYGGAAFTQDMSLATDLQLNGIDSADGRQHGLRFDPGPLYGVKVGYFFRYSLLGGNVGLEAEAYRFENAIRPQTARFKGTLGGVPFDGPVAVPRADADVIGTALNLLYRFPLASSAELPHGRVQPYLGIGLAVLVAEFSTRTSPFEVNKVVSDTDVQPALQLLAGVRTFVTRNVALFFEYRFLHSEPFTFRFRESGTIGGGPFVGTARERANLTSHHLAAGIGFHW